ncbi:MAG: histidine kinase [Bryobacteraceae bacterium]|nr:histidine kinase [Bryobacteraceae bacterium]
MHPLLAERRWILYGLAWTPVCALLAYFQVRSGAGNWLASLLTAAPLSAFYAAICLTPWFLCRRNPLSERSAVTIVVTSVAASLAAAAIWAAFAQLILDGGIGWLWAGGVLLYLLSITFHYLLSELEALRASREREMQSVMMAREAELKALRQQVNPHFLFNSLNSISALTSIDRERARRMCVQLADFFRLSLAIGDRRLIPVSEELALARHYLAIEQVRFAERLRVEERVEPAALAVLVPPLLMQPLIENAVKHGIAQMIEGGVVRIFVATGENDLMLAVENRYDPESPAPRGAGVGLENVRRRLAAVYGGGARLEARAANSMYRAEIRLLKKGAGT